MRQHYEPPEINNVNLSTAYKQFDSSHLHQIQYQISGLTRPLDRLTYQLQNHQ